MWVEELQTRLDGAFQELEHSVRRQQQIWRRDYQQLEQLLAQSRQRKRSLASKLSSLSPS